MQFDQLRLITLLGGAAIEYRWAEN